MEPILEANDVYSGYGRLQIINGISLTVNKSELITIIGPNGSGKSTFIKSLVGLVSLFPGCGDINIYDKGVPMKINGLRPHEIIKMGIPIGYVPQLENVFPSLTIEENLKMGYYVKKKYDSNYLDKLEEIFNLFPILKERFKQKASLLSGGERQMLALARSLMPSPQILILDEPTAALAPNTADFMLKTITELKEKLSVSIMLVEQRAKKSLSISDRGYVFVTGRIAAEGKANELLQEDKIRKLYLGVRE